MLTRSSWFEGLSDKVYPSPEDLAEDVVEILREEIIALRDQGCDFVQLDEPILSQVVFGEESTETFMCAALPNRRDPTDELEMAVRLMNETLEGIEGIRTGVHICRGNWSRKEEVLLTGNYGPMLPYLIQMNIDQLVLECATPRAGEMEVFKEYSNEKEIGLGVVNPRTDEIESPEQIVARVKELLQYFSPDKIYLNPDCGFGTFAERNVNTHEMAAKKMHVITEAAEILRAEYA
jgi:5-methyltetrahydropteroyltriglutamate--homocysteine methyltransferase